MDIFVDNLDKIRNIAKRFVARTGDFYEVDELVNAAYIKYITAITNNPDLAKDQFSKLGVLLYRIKFDMHDYMRDESKHRQKKRMEEKGLFIPEHINMSFRPEEGCNERYFEPSFTDEGYKDVDREDLFDALFMKVHLTNTEWDIIQGYFYDERTLLDLSEGIGLSDGRICQMKKQICKKLSLSMKSLV